MEKYVRLAEGYKRWGRDGWTIRQGEVKKCPEYILDMAGKHLVVVSKPRVLRKIVQPKPSINKDKEIDDAGSE